MYDNDPDDVEALGWDRFVTGVWESIFVGYRSFSGIRTIGRRWSDLLQGGLGCSEGLADELVRAEIILRQDRDLLVMKDPDELMRAMGQALADIGTDLAEDDSLDPAERSRLLAAHAELWQFLRDDTFGPDEDETGAGQLPGT